MKRLANLTAAVLVAALVASPVFAARGSADFTRFVAIGDSYGAGTTNNSTNERHQVWSWPAVIARQAGVTLCTPASSAADNCFAQPLISWPGLGPELQLLNFAPTIAPASGLGTPLMTTFGRPYNNLAVPGLTLGGTMVLKGNEPPAPGEPTAVTFGRFILRGQGTVAEQAVAQHPTFIALFIGGNDALASIFAGTPAVLPAADVFKASYEALLDALIAGAPTAGMVTGTIPAFPPPYALAIKPYIVDPATGATIPGPDGKPIYFIADLGGGTIGQLPPGSMVLLHARTKLATGYGFPPVPPFTAFPDAGKPLADGDVITPTEFATIMARVAAYNTSIVAASAARNVPVVALSALWNKVFSATGKPAGPVTLTPAPVTGGFYSLDFFHLTDIGYTLMANEYIRLINDAYDSHIPAAGVWQHFANNGAWFPDDAPSAQSTNAGAFMTDEAISQIMSMWVQPEEMDTEPADPVTTPVVRRRGAGH